MADNKDEPIVDVQGALTRSESFIENNKKSILVILVAIVGLVAIWLLYREFIFKPDVVAAEEEVLFAEKYLEKDSFRLALNGDGVNKGFLDIIDEFGNTPSGNASKYYAGICYYQLGNYEECIETLKDFDPKGIIVGPIANILIGDANMELGKPEVAAEFYLKGANMDRNEMTTPLGLMKAGKAYEDLGNFADAVAVYEQIKSEYPESTEGKEIDKYLAYARTMSDIEQ